MSAVREKTVVLDGMRVLVREIGEGPPVLLINGLGAHTAMWSPLEDALEGLRVLEFDAPGAGQSARPWRPVGVPRLARLATLVLDHFGVERADVLGYSMGGIVTQQLAADFPERVRRIVLVATSPGLGGMLGDAKAMLNIVTPLRYLSPQLYTSTIASLAGGRARNDREWVARQGTLRLRHAPSMHGYMGQLASLTGWSGLPLLADIKQPTLVVTGDDDPLTPVVNAMMLAHLLPNGRLLVCRGEGHLLLMDSDSVCLEPIREFLAAASLDDAPAWDEANEVPTDDLRVALAGTGWQAPLLGFLGALKRRRWIANV